MHLTEAAEVARHVAASGPTRPGTTEIRMEMRAGTSFTTLLEVVVDPITTAAPADEVWVRYSSSAALLIVGRGGPAAPRGILGRTATGVLMHATCPVIFAGPHRRLRYAG